MKKVFSLFGMLVMMHVAPAFASGVLLETKGAVNVTIANKSVKPKSGLELPDGSSVQPQARSSAKVMLLDGSILSIAAGQTYTVGVPPKPQQRRTMIAGLGTALNEANAAGKGPTVHGMVKMGQPGTGPAPTFLGASLFNKVSAQYPVNTAIELPTSIDFVWTSAEPLPWEKPVLILTDMSAQKQILVRDLQPKQQKLTLNAAEAKLAAGGRYWWNLGSKSGEKALPQTSNFSFRILSPAEQSRVDADVKRVRDLGLSSADAEAMLIAQVYYKHGLYQKMVDALLPYRNAGNDTVVRTLLYMGYMRMGLNEQMAQYQQ